MFVGSDGSNFAIKLLGYLQEADYRVADSNIDRRSIYRLRYDAYVKEGTINKDQSRMFYDAYDDFDNCWIFGVYLDGKLSSSIRLHVISPENRKGPALDVFPDIVGPMLDAGHTLIDPTRFVADHEVAADYPEIPFMTLRAAVMASEYFDAEYCLATVRREHMAFYRRVFNAKIMCEPRPYPSLNAPIALMRAETRNVMHKLARRYPIFESSFTERRMIFEQRENQSIQTLPEFMPGMTG